MKSGIHTSEFWLAVKWSALAGAGVAALLAFPRDNWPAALVALPAVCVMVYLAGLQAHNYSENRFQLKARQMPAPDAGPAEPARTMGFGRYVADERTPHEGDDDERDE